jgi:hypothetical protein
MALFKVIKKGGGFSRACGFVDDHAGLADLLHGALQGPGA